jgi:hypothetical protein
MKKNSRRLVVCGDSWTYGSEIRDPLLPASVNDWDAPNDDYRLPRIWPTKLGKLMGAEEVVNLSYPAASNDRTVRHLIGWLTEHYLKPGRSTEDLFVVVGLTSPERKDFYYKDGPAQWWCTLWPMWGHKYPQEPIQTFSKAYVSNFYNAEESTHRYVNQLFYMQSVFRLHNIKFVFFQAFYQYKDMHLVNWVDAPYARDYKGQPDQYMWDLIDPVRFMHKNEPVHSFHNYITIKDTSTDKKQAFLTMHPSELAHTWWAEHIYNHCEENLLW